MSSVVTPNRLYSLKRARVDSGWTGDCQARGRRDGGASTEGKKVIPECQFELYHNNEEHPENG